MKLPWPPLWFKKVLFLEGRHAVIEVFTTRQKCDGTKNVGDSDAWLNRLLCTDCRAALWIVMPHFIVLRLKGSPLRELHYSTPCSFWYNSPQNKDRVSKARRTPTDSLVKLRIHCDRTLTKNDRKTLSLTSRCLLLQHKLCCKALIILHNHQKSVCLIQPVKRSALPWTRTCFKSRRYYLMQYSAFSKFRWLLE